MTVSLLPDAQPSAVIESLGELVTRRSLPAQATRNEASNNYLRWANEAVRQLSGRVSERDVERLVLTASCVRGYARVACKSATGCCWPIVADARKLSNGPRSHEGASACPQPNHMKAMNPSMRAATPRERSLGVLAIVTPRVEHTHTTIDDANCSHRLLQAVRRGGWR
jgi:hypothetical protein